MPYVLVGGQSFFDRREIRDLMSYLKTILNPNDEIPMLRIINTPARGIGTATVEKILRRAVNKKERFWEVIPESLSSGEMTAKAFQATESFRHLIDRYRKEFEQDPKRMPDTMLKLVGEINYEAEIEKQYKDPHQQLARSETIDQLIDSMKQYVSRAEQPSLSGYLEEAALLGRDEEADQEEQTTENAITLMTLHSAKGLEFPRVYLVGLEEGLLPHHRSLDDSKSAIAEERRLAYVGITRAMDQLTISRAAGRLKWGKRRPSIPSRFLFEMRGPSEERVADESVD